MSEGVTAAVPALAAAFRSDPGRVRTNNEDVPLVDAERGVFGVIDGVGGQAAGEFAAAIAYDVILQRLARPLGTPAERVREAIALANNEIFRRAGAADELSGMTCVVTLAIVGEGRLTIGHVGDSRLYKIRPEGIQKLTHDHSPVGEREDAQEIAELDAMRHPRRNEVFRDVGGALRDKDEEDYVEVIEQPFEPDAAILLCSDGLTDMVPSTTIDRLVCQHAGYPEAVVDALVAAANEAGGRDNVTVVYAEGADFARASRSAARHGRTALPPGVTTERSGTPAPDANVARPAERPLGLIGAIVRSRATSFTIGAVAGVVAVLLLVWRTPDGGATNPRTIAVAPAASAAFLTLGAGLSAARPGDELRLEPGTYAERITLGDGVSLAARVPGSVTFVRPPVSGEIWTAIDAASGDLGGRLSGIRIDSTVELPIDVGIRIAGQSRTLELIEMAGPMRAGVELLPGAAATINGGMFSVAGSALLVGDRAQISAWGSTFLCSVRTVPPIRIGEATQFTLQRNVFAGCGAELVAGASVADQQQIPSANVIVTAEPSPAR